MLFKGNHLPTSTIDLERLGSFALPFERTIATVDDLVDHRTSEAPAFLTCAPQRSIPEIYAATVHERGGRIVDHGVEYDSLREAGLCSRYPPSNSTSHFFYFGRLPQFFYFGRLQLMPSGTLFLDNRRIDRSLSIPIDVLLCGNLVDRAIERRSPAFADIPRGDSGVPIDEPYGRHWLGSLATSLRDRLTTPTGADAHWTKGPWPDHGELIRTHDFIRETLDEHDRLVRNLPFLSWTA